MVMTVILKEVEVALRMIVEVMVLTKVMVD